MMVADAPNRTFNEVGRDQNINNVQISYQTVGGKVIESYI